jgi:tripartite-type tricarboxylate transporter receptor subunit TctC
VPFAAGGGGDLVARLLAREIGERTRATIVVENRVGAGGNIAAAAVLKGRADGYTVLNLSSTYAIQGALARLPFDPLADLQPVAMVVRDPALLIVPAASPLRSFRDLVTQARAAPGKLSYGSAGPGSSAHMGMEDLAAQLGVQLMHVPYKGTSQAFTDLLAGTIDVMFTSMPHGVPLIRSGRIRALGQAGLERSPVLPEVPTIAEQGAPGYTFFDWKAVALPKGAPAEAVAFLNREVNEVLRQRAVADRFESEGSTVVGGTPEQMLQVVRGDIERWKQLARKANLRVE